MQRIEIEGKRLYVDEAFALRFAWLAPTGVPPAILSVEVRFPSGRTSIIHFRLSSGDIEAGRITIPGFASGESGRAVRPRHGARRRGRHLAAERDLRRVDAQPGADVRDARLPHPVRLGRRSKYDFGNGRWYCHSQVRWVNGEARSVNLGRRVDVHVTDAGIGTVADFSFDLSGDIVVPAFSTVYGSWYTWHGERRHLRRVLRQGRLDVPLLHEWIGVLAARDRKCGGRCAPSATT